MFSRIADHPSVIGAIAVVFACACGSGSKPPATSQSAVSLDDTNQGTNGKSSSESHAPSAAVSQAMKAIEAKHFDEAKGMLTKAVADKDAGVLAPFYVGVAYSGLGDGSQAVSAYQKAMT